MLPGVFQTEDGVMLNRLMNWWLMNVSATENLRSMETKISELERTMMKLNFL